MPEDQQIRMLQSAVHGVEVLRNIQLQADLHVKLSGSSVSFESYRSLLLDCAASYDSNLTTTKGRPSGREQRSVFRLETLFDPYASSYDDDDRALECKMGLHTVPLAGEN